MDETLIHYTDVEIHQQELCVLSEVNLQLHKGEFVYLVGKVGSGKTSLLKTLYGELDVTAGEAEVLGYRMTSIKRKHIPQLRRKLGIVFQDFQLLTDRTVNDNLEFVLRATGWKNKQEIKERIAEVLNLVGMENKGYKLPNELSGGEQQRIVIARAMLNSPEIILADEPTGNLDVETGKAINTASVMHYKTKAKLLREMGRAEESCQVYDRAMFLADSLTRKEQLSELGEIQVKNEVAQLELEKADIVIRIRNIAFYSTIILIFVVIGFIIYLAISLKRTRKLQKELLHQTHKAQESERMQSSFIRSMYNDVCAPLDHINKQTQRIRITSLSPVQKAECSKQIQESCRQLTSLLDEMLEKAYHESTTESQETPPD